MRVKAEAGNGCATWEIIQLSDQRGHTRGLITSSSTAGQPARRPGACVSQLATLTYLNVVHVVHLMLLLSANILETQHSVQHYIDFRDLCNISFQFHLHYSSKAKPSVNDLLPFYQQCVLK